MRALVIGGTGFLGGAITNRVLDEGFEVDVLTRQSLVSGHPRLSYLRGDRYKSFPDVLRNYDFVFDTCAFEPEALKSVVSHLDLECLKQYIFISSASVYEEYKVPGLSEEKDLKGASQSDYELVKSLPNTKKTSAFSYGDSYGRLKRECELFLERHLNEKAIILRSGLLVGAGDYTDRLTWWVRRLDLSGTVVCPLPKGRPIQLIDVRDAADFAVKAAVDGSSGVFNLTGRQVTFEKLLSTIKENARSGADLKWVGLDSFAKKNLEPWTDIPLAVPEVESLKYFFDIDTRKAFDAGLEVRALEDTILNILTWDRENRDRTLKCGYSIETEQAVALDQAKLG
jgi:2'-hydroxyisoflavone reductase